MSYDIWLYKELDGEQHDVFEVGNCTSNVSRMWTQALGENLGDLIQSTPVASELLPRIQAAVAAMEADRDTYRAMNPTNGWGSYEGACDYLRKLVLGCRLHPDAKVSVSR